MSPNQDRDNAPDVARRAGALISFDIDGTLEAGDPPGPVCFQVVQRARNLGFAIGSASDRTLSSQRAMWNAASIVPDFICHKHLLADIAADFVAYHLLHVGDTEMDKYYASLAGFQYCHPRDLAGHSLWRANAT